MNNKILNRLAATADENKEQKNSAAAATKKKVNNQFPISFEKIKTLKTLLKIVEKAGNAVSEETIIQKMCQFFDELVYPVGDSNMLQNFFVDNNKNTVQLSQAFTNLKQHNKIGTWIVGHVISIITDKKNYNLFKDYNYFLVSFKADVMRWLLNNATFKERIAQAWKAYAEKFGQNQQQEKSRKLPSMSDSTRINDNLFNKATFKYENPGQVFSFINDEFKLENINEYPSSSMLMMKLNEFKKNNPQVQVNRWAMGMRYSDGTLFVIAEQSMGTSGYQALKNTASAQKIYKVESRQKNKIMTQRMAKKVI